MSRSLVGDILKPGVMFVKRQGSYLSAEIVRVLPDGHIEYILRNEKSGPDETLVRVDPENFFKQFGKGRESDE